MIAVLTLRTLVENTPFLEVARQSAAVAQHLRFITMLRPRLWLNDAEQPTSRRRPHVYPPAPLPPIALLEGVVMLQQGPNALAHYLLLQAHDLPMASDRLLRTANPVQVSFADVPLVPTHELSRDVRTVPSPSRNVCARLVPLLLLQLTTPTLPSLIWTSLLLPWTHKGQTGVMNTAQHYIPLAEVQLFLWEPAMLAASRAQETPVFIPSYPASAVLVPTCFARCLRSSRLTHLLPPRQLKEVQNVPPLSVRENAIPHLRCSLGCAVLVD